MTANEELQPSEWFPEVGDVDRVRFAREARKPKPRAMYVMFFTPRSGSSWFTDVARSSGILGIPTEAFNPNWFRKMAVAFNATDMKEYGAILQRRLQRDGTCGTQITWHQLSHMFSDPSEMLRILDATHHLWLIRRDIVAQAVSLAKMVATGVTHSPQSDGDMVRAADAAFAYDAQEITRWLKHILLAEERTEAYFDAHGMAPLRMTYERNMSLGPEAVVRVVLQYLGKRPGQTVLDLPESAHVKIGTALNDEFSARFREEERAFVEDVDARRVPMLEKFVPYRVQLRQE